MYQLIIKRIFLFCFSLTIIFAQKLDLEEINKLRKASNNLVLIGNSKILNQNINNSTYYLVYLYQNFAHI